MSERVRVEPPQSPPFDRELDAPEVIIGRATTAGLVVPDSSMSRHHARLFQRDGRWWVEDLGATNGTSLPEDTKSCVKRAIESKAHFPKHKTPLLIDKRIF